MQNQDEQQLLERSNASVTNTVHYNSSSDSHEINLLTTNQQLNNISLTPANQFQKRLDDLYPSKRIWFIGLIFILINLIIILVEAVYSLPIAKLKSNTYNSLITTRYIANTSFINVIYGILALISSKYNKIIIIK
jgi:hypothetical protein